MKENFECAYISIGGTMCLYFDTNIIDNAGDSKCEFCIMNNNCEYCLHELTQHRENCINCNIKENQMSKLESKKTKELLVCTCGNSKNKIYAEFEGLKMTRIFVKCPKCKKESLVAYLEGGLSK